MPFTERSEAGHSHLFFCPGCKMGHGIDDRRWTVSGTPEKPTIRASVLVRTLIEGNPDGVCHSFVTDGKIEFLSDSTHALAGQTVELPEL